MIIAWADGQGFPPHRHDYDHPFMVVEGEVLVRHAGYTKTIVAGEGLTHVAGAVLTAVAVGPATIEVNHK